MRERESEKVCERVRETNGEGERERQRQIKSETESEIEIAREGERDRMRMTVREKGKVNSFDHTNSSNITESNIESNTSLKE